MQWATSALKPPVLTEKSSADRRLLPGLGCPASHETFNLLGLSYFWTISGTICGSRTQRITDFPNGYEGRALEAAFGIGRLYPFDYWITTEREAS